MTRPDEKQSPGGFETAAELRQTEEAEGRPDLLPPPARSAPQLAYERRRRVLIAAGIVLVLFAVAVALYLVV